MTDQIVEKVKRGLFTIGAKPAGPVPSAAVPSQTAAQAAEALEKDALVQRLNIKALAAALASASPAASAASAPLLQTAGRGSHAPSMTDVASPWFAYWAQELKCRPDPERKLWEAVTVLQAFYEAGVLRPGARVLGFGIGNEALPSYLASIGLDVVATDLPGVTDPDLCWKPELLGEADFDSRVEVSDLDIRRLDDATLRNLDACWSCNVLDALTTPEQAAEAAILTMDTLRPGGVAVHITEFAFSSERPVSHAHALCFPRAFFETLASALDGRGHRVAPLDFSLGDHALDGYIDASPFGSDIARDRPPHLKVLIGDEIRTSFALVVTARG